MKKIANLVTIISGIIVILSILFESKFSNKSILYVIHILKSIYFEILILILIIKFISLIKKKGIFSNLKKYYILFKIEKDIIKLIMVTILVFLSITIIHNTYYLSRAKVFFFNNSFLSLISEKDELLKEAIKQEKLLNFKKAISFYEEIINIDDKYQNNTFIKNKIKTLNSRVQYSNIFLNISLDELNKDNKKVTQKGASSIILSYILYPNKENQKILNDYKFIIDYNLDKVIKNNDYDSIESIIGHELMTELLNDSIKLDDVINKVDKQVLKKYLINSYSYNLIDTIANNGYK